MQLRGRASSRYSLGKTLITLCASLSAWPIAEAQLNDNTVKGAVANHLFAEAYGDSIDTLSGQLYFQVPLGGAYAVTPRLTYQPKLVYTSKVWRFHPRLSDGRNQLDGRAHAGVGFYLQMGRLYWKWSEPECSVTGDTRKLILQLADGAEHDITPLESVDLSYLRVERFEAPGGTATYSVTTSDGIRYEFDHWVDDPEHDPNSTPWEDCIADGRGHDYRTSDFRGWYVTSITDPFAGKSVSIEYEPRAGMRHLIRRIYETGTSRQIIFTNAVCDADAGLVCASGVTCDPNSTEACDPQNGRQAVGYVTSVKVPSFNRPTTAPDPATYRFHYAVTTTTNAIVKPPLDLPDPDYDEVLEGEVFLTRIELPEGYEITYDYEDHWGLGHIGVVTTRTLPSGAEVRYSYARYAHAIDPPAVGTGLSCIPFSCQAEDGPMLDGFVHTSTICGGGTCSVPSSAIEDFPATTEVISKAIRWNPGASSSFSESPPIAEDRWSWNRNFVYDPNGQHRLLGNPYKVIETDPLGNTKVHFFAASIANKDPNQTYDDLHLYDWDDGLLLKTEEWVGNQGTLVRSTQYEYEDDFIEGPNPGEVYQHFMSNRRVKSVTTMNYEGGPRGKRVAYEDWDGYGHYRVAREYGFGNRLHHTTRTGYNCFVQDANGVCEIRSDHASNWVLNTYAFQETLNDTGSVIRQSDFEFGGDGQVRRRIDRSAPNQTAALGSELWTVGPEDVVTTWVYYGGSECGAFGCPSGGEGQPNFLAIKQVEKGSPSTPFEATHRETLTYQAGFYPRTRRLGGMPWLSEDVDRDASTGLVSVSRDTAGVPTSFNYDTLGRLTRAEPGGAGSGEAPITVSYPTLFQAEVRQPSFQDPNQELRVRNTFDQLFGLLKEERWMDDGTIAARAHSYDAVRRRVFESEWGSTANGTTYDYSYAGGGAVLHVDPLPRPHRIVRADGSVTRIEYLGPTTHVTVEDLGEDPATPFSATTVYERDAYDRLVSVLASQVLDPQVTTSVISPAANATYEYDVLGNLIEVHLFDPVDSNAVAQSRFFEYDNLGRLRSATHPENGTEHYQIYAATGEVLVRVDPAGNTHEYGYDDAGRLVLQGVSRPGEVQSRVIGEWVYDWHGTGDNANAAGKLRAVLATQEVNGEAESSERVFEYAGLNGRLSRTVNLFPGVDTSIALAQTTSYNDLGLPETVTYPSHGWLGESATELVYTYTDGLLKGIRHADQTPLIPEIRYNAAGGASWIATAGESATEVIPDVMNRPSQIRLRLTPEPEGGGSPPGGGGGGGCQGPNCIGGEGGNYALAPFLAAPGRLIGQSTPFSGTGYDSGLYRYDGQGNIVGIGTEKYWYDGSGRLRRARVKHTDLEHSERSYSYDVYGNLFYVATSALGSPESPLVWRNFNVDPWTNRITTQTETLLGQEASAAPLGVLYDTGGNLVSDGVQQRLFDEQNRMIRLADGGGTVADYVYDHAGHRIVKRHWPSDTETFYFRDGDGRLLSEFRRRISTGASQAPIWLKDYVYVGDQLVASLQDPAPPVPGPITTETSGPDDPNDPGSPTAMVRLTIAPSPAPDVRTYRIRRATTGGSTMSFNIPWAGEGASTFYQDDEPEVQEGVTYTYTVVAIDSALNESSPTREYVITPGDDIPPPPPSAPTATVGDSMVWLSWTDPERPPDHFGYHVYRRRTYDVDPNFYRRSASPSASTGFTDVGLQNFTAYSYYIASVDTAGNESILDPNRLVVLYATPEDLVAPSRPNGLIADAGVDNVALWWAPNPEPDVVEYRVGFWSEPIPDSPACDWGWSVPASTLSLTATASSSTDYYCRICAVDAAGNVSPWTEQVYVRTRNAGTPLLPLLSISFDNCAKGMAQFSGPAYFGYPASDATACTLPGFSYETGMSENLWAQTPFTHENYLEVTIGAYDALASDGFQLYRRRSENQPWERVSYPMDFDDVGLVPPTWPGDRVSSNPIKYALFGIDASTYCGTPYEYAIAGFTNVDDPTTEGGLSRISATFTPIAAPLPAVENLRVVGNSAVSPLNYPPSGSWPNPIPPVEIRWDSHKGVCRPDFQGVRVYAQWETYPSSPTFEVTNGPVTSTGYDWPAGEEFAHCGGSYKLYAQAVATGEVSRLSNWIRLQTICPHTGTCYGPHYSPFLCNQANTETVGFLPEDWDPNDGSPSLPADGPVLTYPGSFGGTSWDVIGVTLAPWLNGQRIRVYREVETSGGTDSTLHSEHQMDQRTIPLAGWGPDPNNTPYAALPNAFTDCEAGVSYSASYVDLVGRESLLSDPISARGLALASATVDSSGAVFLTWGTAPFCGSASYVVYKADAPDDQPCWTWDPDPNDLLRLTTPPISAQSYSDTSGLASITAEGSSTAGSAWPSGQILLMPGQQSQPGPDVVTETPTFEWEAHTGGSIGYGVKLWQKRSDGMWKDVHDSETAVGTLVDTFSYTLPAGVLIDGKRYKWKVRQYSETSGWSNYSDPLYFRAVLSSDPPPDKLVYFVRVLRGTADTPDVDWPPPRNRVCVEVQQASLEPGSPSEDGWAVAALSPGGRRHDLENGGEGDAAAPSTDGWKVAELIPGGGSELRGDAGEDGATAASVEEDVAGGWRPGSLDRSGAALYHEGRYEIVKREGVEVLPGWTALLGPGGPLMPGPELRVVLLERWTPEVRPVEGVITAGMVAGDPSERPMSVAGMPGVEETGSASRPSGSRLIGQSAVEKEVLFFHNDHLGSPFAVTNLEGMVVSRHEYGPFGEELEPKGDNTHTRRFTSHERDEESGLDYMLSRYYAAPLGRFLSVDPGEDTDLLDTQSWNKYAYARNNPIVNIDPDGRSIWSTIVKVAIKAAKTGDVAMAVKGAFEDAGTMVDPKQSVGVRLVAALSLATEVLPVSAKDLKTGAKALGLADASKAAGGLDDVRDATRGTGERFSEGKQALVDMAQGDKRTGVTSGDMQAYKDLNSELPDPFPSNAVRGPEAHPSGGPHSQRPHGHVGPVRHIPIIEPLPER